MKNFPMLPSKSNQFLAKLKTELDDNMNKRQIYRTETEMRASVLNDGKHPTRASKYWQCVREQGMMYENLRMNTFDYRKRNVELLRKKDKIQKCEDEFDRMELEIEIEELGFALDNIRIQAMDRVREIEHWSRIKAELDDGSFDTENVNTHQSESLELQLRNRLNTLSSGSSQSEILNVVGPLETIQKLNERIEKSELNGAIETRGLNDRE
jgi:hypothetical protein